MRTSESEFEDLGNIDAPIDAFDTLDEPIKDTILRDLKQIARKLRHVLLPVGTGSQLREWDLWGPLLLCLMLAILLSWGAPAAQTSLVFAAVFVIFWCGAALVTLNGALLGGNISFFQSVCVLGYCVFPLNVSSIFGIIFSSILVKGLIVLGGFLWSTRASVGFMAQLVPEEKRVLGVYPVLLFYFTISWMILLTL